MNRSLLLFALTVIGVSPSVSAAPERVIGAVQPEIRLSDGTVFRNARVLRASAEKSSATISDGTTLRVVSLSALPEGLRTQVVDELGRTRAPRYGYNVSHETRPAPPPDKVILPPASVDTPYAPAAPATAIDQLIAQASTRAADELKLYLLKSHERSVSSLTTTVRKAEQVPGWQKIRVSGDAAYSTWDNFRRDYVWRTEKFEVEFAIVDGKAIQADRVSFAGVSRMLGVD